ncbi:hypothetical protein EW145_g8364 [Phellinidium pouzarii]|uniref:Uncharacterized protein n=1 Tax=Phellinidium pouzarii TaxID=167371 RepID=A0A4S4K6P2_9AGAM|nr:hypothetical protein EW145_g8364 [Phellinidium pouzarii]
MSSLSFTRVYSPVPPRCPSPQLNPMPLPTPPLYARRPSITQEQRAKARRACIHSDSLKDALVAGPSSARRLSRHDPREPIAVTGKRSRIVATGSSASTSPTSCDQPVLSPLSRSMSRARTRSLSGRTTRCEDPPPVPPLPSMESKGCNARHLLSKNLPPIRIPELGLGIDENFRSPLSPLQLTPTSRRRRERASKEPDAPSFLHMTKNDTKRASRASLGSSGCASIRISHSLPDLKAAKRRSSPSFAVRFLRIGT